MALFSRRPKRPMDSDAPVTDAVTDAAHDVAADAASGAAAGAGAGSTAAPAVGISVSSFGGLGGAVPAAIDDGDDVADGPVAPGQGMAPVGDDSGVRAAPAAASPRPRGAETAPPPTETVAGLVDNVLLRDAVAAFAAEPDTAAVMNVARQLMQGQLYLRVQGDARALLADGKGLPFAVAHRGDEQFAVVFSGGSAMTEAVRADGNTGTSALGQASLAVLRNVLQDTHAGIIVDHWAGQTTPVLPRALLERAVAEADPESTVKNLLAAVRTAETAAAVAHAMTTVPLWIAANRASEIDPWGIAETRTEAGERFLEVFSHPLEVVALGRGDQPMPLAPAQLGRALQGDAALTGVLVDPAGPWIRLTRDDLAPVIALAA